MKSKINILVLLKIYKGDLNPFDECALEFALRIPNAKVTALAMAPLSAKPALENITRLGADAVLVCDNTFAGSDTIATAKILAKVVEYYNPDLVFAGRKSIDGSTAQTPIMLADLIRYEFIGRVIDINEGNVITRGGNKYSLEAKQLLTFEKSKLLRSPSIFSAQKEITILTNKELNVDKELIGQRGSKTIVRKTYINESGRRFCDFFKKEELDNLIKTGLEKTIEEVTEEKSVEEIYYVGDIRNVSLAFAKRVVELEINNKTIEEICLTIKEKHPKIILWEEKEEIKELACQVAIRMGIGLCAECTDVRMEDGKVIITRPALGGDIMADIECTTPISMATINKTKEEEDIAFVVGKGAVQYLPKIREMAKKYDAKIYCTRPLADNGIIDYLYQVGLSGISITPKVCVLIGLSGSVQTIVGINKSKVVIAINKLRKEKVFDYADYGIVIDIKDL